MHGNSTPENREGIDQAPTAIGDREAVEARDKTIC
jgi:hypothetical protein